MYSFAIFISVLKALLFYILIVLLYELDLSKPFNNFVTNKILQIRYYTFSIGILSHIARQTAKIYLITVINCLAMPIDVNLDVMMAKRKMSLNELSDKVDLTLANLSILKTGKAKAIRFSIDGSSGHIGGAVNSTYRTVSLLLIAVRIDF